MCSIPERSCRNITIGRYNAMNAFLKCSMKSYLQTPSQTSDNCFIPYEIIQNKIHQRLDTSNQLTINTKAYRVRPCKFYYLRL